METSAHRGGRPLAVVLVVVCLIGAAFQGAWAHAALASHLIEGAVLAAAAAATARLARGGAGGRPIRLTTAFLLAALLHLPAPGAVLVLLPAAVAARGAGLAGYAGGGLASFAANLGACTLVQGLVPFLPGGGHALTAPALMRVALAFAALQAGAFGLRLLLEAKPAPGPWRARTLARTLGWEAVNVPLAWLLLIQAQVAAPLVLAALAAVLVAGGFGLRALDRTFRELQSANRALAARVTELATLHALGREILSSLDPEKVSRVIERECRKIFEVDFFVLALRDRNAAEFRVLHRAGRGEQPQTSVVPPGDGLVAWVADNMRGLVVDDFENPDEPLPFKPRVVEPGLRSALAVPLVVEERVIGVLSIQSRKPRVYDDHLLSVLTTIGQQAAVAIENARHYTLATVDSLTGLFLRDYFFRRVEEEYTRCARYGGSFSILMLDLDRFKDINDQAGHLAGDRYLRALGHSLRSRLRGADLACRYGGDEFCLLLPETDLGGARPIAERLRATIAALAVDVGGTIARSTVSIGLATFPEHDAGDLKTLLLRADQALYQAKRLGRDRVVPFAA